MKNIFFKLLALFMCRPEHQEKMNLESFYVINNSHIEMNSDSSIEYRYKYDNYIVTNFTDSPENQKQLDSFICQNASDSITIYRDYSIKIFNKSKYTNNSYYFENSKIFDLEISKDMVYIYVWTEGKFLYKWRIFGDDGFIQAKITVDCPVLRE